MCWLWVVIPPKYVLCVLVWCRDLEQGLVHKVVVYFMTFR